MENLEMDKLLSELVGERKLWTIRELNSIMHEYGFKQNFGEQFRVKEYVFFERETGKRVEFTLLNRGTNKYGEVLYEVLHLLEYVGDTTKYEYFEKCCYGFEELRKNYIVEIGITIGMLIEDLNKYKRMNLSRENWEQYSFNSNRGLEYKVLDISSQINKYMLICKALKDNKEDKNYLISKINGHCTTQGSGLRVTDISKYELVGYVDTHDTVEGITIEYCELHKEFRISYSNKAVALHEKDLQTICGTIENNFICTSQVDLTEYGEELL